MINVFIVVYIYPVWWIGGLIELFVSHVVGAA